MSSQLVSNLNYLLSSQSLTIMALSRNTGIPQPTLHHIVSGKTKKPRFSIIENLAHFFDISVVALLKSNLLIQSLTKLKKTPILTWNKSTLSFNESNPIEPSLYNAYEDERFAFYINKNDCHSFWPDNSLAVISKSQSPQEGITGLVWLKNHGLILNKIYQEQDNFFINYKKAHQDDLLLLKFNLKQDMWYGSLIELRLVGRHIIDSYILSSSKIVAKHGEG
ncbi:helix-turn-helix domain-containing protein (plasmid) [Legionella sp. D16C41]|uniref:helix-turn-helix domain-containing protein n=1 Tax=Legionella sp. D16C41 TaxID=3402688 RepID=UPI003AF5BF49